MKSDHLLFRRVRNAFLCCSMFAVAFVGCAARPVAVDRATGLFPSTTGMPGGGVPLSAVKTYTPYPRIQAVKFVYLLVRYSPVCTAMNKTDVAAYLKTHLQQVGFERIGEAVDVARALVRHGRGDLVTNEPGEAALKALSDLQGPALVIDVEITPGRRMPDRHIALRIWDSTAGNEVLAIDWEELGTGWAVCSLGIFPVLNTVKRWVDDSVTLGRQSRH